MCEITAEKLLRAIRSKCLDCSGNSMKCVNGCRIHHCPLYPFRNEKIAAASIRQPQLKGQMTLEELLEVK